MRRRIALLHALVVVIESFMEHDFQLGGEAGNVYAERLENFNGEAGGLAHNGIEHVLGAGERVVAAHAHGYFNRLHKHVLSARRKSFDVGILVNRTGEVGAERGLLHAAHFHHLARRAVGSVEHGENYVFAAYIAAAVELCGAFGLFDYFKEIRRKFSVVFHLIFPPYFTVFLYKNKALVAAYVPPF